MVPGTKGNKRKALTRNGFLALMKKKRNGKRTGKNTIARRRRKGRFSLAKTIHCK